MSNKQKPLTINILGEEYMISCDPGEEEALRDSVNFLDNRMKEIRASGKVMSNERIAVMAALNLTNEVLSLREQVNVNGEQLTRKIKNKTSAMALGVDEAPWRWVDVLRFGARFFGLHRRA